MSEKRPCVYVLASKRNGTLYVGVTSDIARRAWQHRLNAVGGFASTRWTPLIPHSPDEAAIFSELGAILD